MRAVGGADGPDPLAEFDTWRGTDTDGRVKTEREYVSHPKPKPSPNPYPNPNPDQVCVEHPKPKPNTNPNSNPAPTPILQPPGPRRRPRPRRDPHACLTPGMWSTWRSEWARAHEARSAPGQESGRWRYLVRIDR